MQKIESLLKNIINQKDEIVIIVDEVCRITGVLLERDNIKIITHRGGKKVFIKTSGAKKTKLVLHKNELIKSFLNLGFIVAL